MSREYIAQALKRLRENSGLTADQVGAMVGKSGKTVNAWENNRGQPDAEILIKLCDIYNVGDILSEFREDNSGCSISLSEHEKRLISAYRDKPEMQPAVDKLLGIDSAPAKNIGEDIAETVINTQNALNTRCNSISKWIQ